MSPTPVFTLDLNSNWQVTADEALSPGTRLTHHFWLEPLDICVGYWLHVESAPAGTAIYMNDQPIGRIENETSFASEVTDFVWLETNTITFMIQDSGGIFPLSGIRLEAIPCE